MCFCPYAAIATIRSLIKHESIGESCVSRIDFDARSLTVVSVLRHRRAASSVSIPALGYPNPAV